MRILSVLGNRQMGEARELTGNWLEGGDHRFERQRRDRGWRRLSSGAASDREIPPSRQLRSLFDKKRCKRVVRAVNDRARQ